ncbi:MAG: hypothetical protein A2857_04695 [Candidatus Levybacteria bacterium RIFCSPHIGHO2_01_FULL_36_15]|nr:MAG: hypothetical protein A2857_04695 [Candidatus Levybacteria bacterium RIFCSPHIGHO2_01_FULL_36_15]
MHKDEAYFFSRDIIEKLKKEIPKHSFVVALQARIGGKIIASDKIGALHKDVLAKMSGGDYTRKSKLLEKQKKGKEKMKTIGEVNVPKEVFMNILKT